MGLFDRFKKKEEPKIPTYAPETQKQESLIESYSYTGKDGQSYLECEYYDQNSDFKKFYDTTKLVICTTPEVLPSGRTVYSARVAYYGNNDAVYFGNDGQDMGRRNQFTKIRLGINFDKLLNDPEYQKVLMNGLLDQKRVERYVNAGLQDHPTNQMPCGNYVGCVDINQRTGKYGKIFDARLGEEVHNLPSQVNTREQYKQMQEQQREIRISKLEAERARLDAQIATERGASRPEGEER